MVPPTACSSYSIFRTEIADYLGVPIESGHLLPRGLALREILITCVERIASDLGGDRGLSRACQYLVLLKEGLSCQEISNELGLSREHVS